MNGMPYARGVMLVCNLSLYPAVRVQRDMSLRELFHISWCDPVEGKCLPAYVQRRAVEGTGSIFGATVLSSLFLLFLWSFIYVVVLSLSFWLL